MRNIEKLSKYIVQHGSKSFIVHTLPSNGSWIVAQKVEADKWALSLGNPMGFTMYSLGNITNNQHLQLWTELIKMEIEKKVELIRRQANNNLK